jgi:hypothetical protein
MDGSWIVGGKVGDLLGWEWEWINFTTLAPSHQTYPNRENNSIIDIPNVTAKENKRQHKRIERPFVFQQQQSQTDGDSIVQAGVVWSHNTTTPNHLPEHGHFNMHGGEFATSCD